MKLEISKLSQKEKLELANELNQWKTENRDAIRKDELTILVATIDKEQKELDELLTGRVLELRSSLKSKKQKKYNLQKELVS